MVREGSSSCNGGMGGGPSKRQLGPDPHSGSRKIPPPLSGSRANCESGPLSLDDEVGGDC